MNTFRLGHLPLALSLVIVCRCTAATAPETVAALVETAASGASMEARFAAVNDVVEAGADAVPVLVTALKHGSSTVRADAARALGRLQDRRATAALLILLEDPDPGVRGTAAEALGRIGDGAALQPLMDMLKGDHENDRRGAAVALGTMRARQAIPALRELLLSENWEERWRAAVALGKIGDRRTAASVAALKRDGNAVVTGCADWAAGAIAGRRGIGQLDANLGSDNGGTVWASAWALGVIGTPDAVAVLKRAARTTDGDPASAARTVLLWLGEQPGGADDTAEPAVAPQNEAGQQTPAADMTDVIDLEDRWVDRYGHLTLTASTPRPLVDHAGQPLPDGLSPRLFQTGNGDLILAYAHDAGADHAPRSVLRSLDDGRTWMPQATLVRALETVATLPDGTTIAYDALAFRKEDTVHAVQICVSRDGGRSFGPLQLAFLDLAGNEQSSLAEAALRQAYEHSAGRWSGRMCPGLQSNVLELEDGRLLAARTTTYGTDAAPRCVLMMSTDRGLHWSVNGTVATEGVEAPTLARTARDSLVCIVSQGPAKAMAQYESTDGGQQWWQTTRLQDPGLRPELVMMSTGALVCAHGGDAVRLMFSTDGTARHWTDRIVLVEGADGDRFEASVRETDPGRLLLIYSGGGAQEDPPGPLNAISITVELSR